METNSARSWLVRLSERVVPRPPDFYVLLQEQCAVVEKGTVALASFMETGDANDARLVRKLEHRGDSIKARNLDLLHRTFATSMDREDIQRAIGALDDVLNYAKSTVNEMAVLDLPPDDHTVAMADLLREGAHALSIGFQLLEHAPQDADLQAEHARKTERRTEKAYRSALRELFDAEHYLATRTLAQRSEAEAIGVLLEPLGSGQGPAVAMSVAYVIEIFKRREVYRHMSNAADRVASAGEILHEIVVKAT